MKQNNRVCVSICYIYYNKYNYEVICSEIISLYKEVKPKLKTTEKEDGDNWQDNLLNYLEFVKIFERVGENGFGGKAGKLFHKNNWLALRKLMLDFEDYVRLMLEEHNLASPNEMEDGGWD